MQRCLTQIICLAALVLVACGPRGSGEPSETSLFTGARLILGDGRVIENGALLVERGRIQRVGTAAEVVAPPGATVVDLSGKTVIPALIDAHAHLGYECYTAWGADCYTRDNVIDNLERYAYYGFGAVFSAGSDPDDLAIGLERDQRLGRIGGGLCHALCILLTLRTGACVRTAAVHKKRPYR